MEPHGQAVMRGGLEQAFDFFRSESDRFAKGIDACGDPLRRCGRDQLIDDLADIMRAAVALAGGKCVERE